MTFDNFEHRRTGDGWLDVLLPDIWDEVWSRAGGLWLLVIVAAAGGQMAAGALAGAGTTWSAPFHGWLTREPWNGVFPSLTLGSTVFLGKAGDVLHVTGDIAIQQGSLAISLSRLGDNPASQASLSSSGAVDVALPVQANGLQSLTFRPHGADGSNLSLHYHLSWRIER